ncbi:MAG: hypothetical protein RBT20_04405 [Syntrophales bacterium]|jgi:hypothetical protein|nr:hypothetical protein [Syntrophales bacterium]
MDRKSEKRLDVAVWCFLVICLGGFLGSLAYIPSPKNSPGIHELIVLGYFFGFVIVYALIYKFFLGKGGGHE